MSNFEDVKTFMKTFGQMVRTKPQFPDEKTIQLRYDLIKEELNELEHAMKTKNLNQRCLAKFHLVVLPKLVMLRRLLLILLQMHLQ